jgi:hypothetical protein
VQRDDSVAWSVDRVARAVSLHDSEGSGGRHALALSSASLMTV